MTLASLVRSEDWNALEGHWADLMAGNAPIDEVLAAVELARETKSVSRILPFVREHADLLEAAERHADAAELLGRTLLAGGPPGELSQRLMRCARAAYESEPWWEAYTQLSGFHEGAADVRKAWRAFSQLKDLGEGSTVFHRSGWGPGQVKEFDRDALEVKIKFANGRPARMPVKSVIETCDVLDPDDMRSLVVSDPDELKRMIAEEQLEVLTRVLRRYNGRTTQAVLKTAMAQLGLEGSAFTSWWRKARKIAEQSTLHEVTGSGAKTQIRLLDAEVDPTENMRRQLLLSKDLGAALSRVRDLLADKSLDDAVRSAALETLDELSDTDPNSAHALSAWVLLRNERGETPAQLAIRVHTAMVADGFIELPAEGEEGEPKLHPTGHEGSDSNADNTPQLWHLFGQMPTARDQEACISILKETFGEENWLEHACANLVHAPAGMVRGLVDELMKAEKQEVLASMYTSLLIRPNRNPHLLIGLAELAEKGKLEGDFPTPLQRVHSLLTLATALFTAEGADPVRTRAQTKLSKVLCDGEPSLMATLLADASRSELRALMPILAKGVDGTVDRAFTHVAISRFPTIYRDDNRPFWEDQNVIWTTERGLAKREDELRELREVKIPANSEAIGKAASYGDLSENSEWEAALEEQRNLTARATEIADEVGKARLVEHAAIPQGVVSPGTRVTYTSAEGDTRTVKLLGPWDSDGEGVISYRSPVAQGMLGKRIGDKATLQLPGGAAEVVIVEVEALEFGASQ